MKKCGRCKGVKPKTEFNKNKGRCDGLQSTCKVCFRTIYYKHDPIKRRIRHLKRYDLDWEIYVNWYELQEGCCAICKTPFKLIGDKNIKSGAHVDHDHDSGEFRALLCHDCNAGLGYFKDNIKLLLTASEYLEWFKSHKPAGK